MAKDKLVCALCGREIEGSNFLGFCSQNCWKNSQRAGFKRNNMKPLGLKERGKISSNGERIIIEETQKDAAYALILQKLEELAVVGITSVIIVHPESIKDEIRSPEFRKQIGALGLKFKMEPFSNDRETVITHICF